MTYTIERIFDYQNLKCVVVMTNMGHRCGYVGVPKDHFLYNANYNNPCWKLNFLQEKRLGSVVTGEDIGWINMFLLSFSEDRSRLLLPEIIFSVHGGITYSGGNEYPIDLIYKKFWWFGFDCAHVGDAKDPEYMTEFMKELEMKYPTGGIVRTTEFCIKQCIKLAEQLYKANNDYNKSREILFRKFRKEK